MKGHCHEFRGALIPMCGGTLHAGDDWRDYCYCKREEDCDRRAARRLATSRFIGDDLKEKLMIFGRGR